MSIQEVGYRPLQFADAAEYSAPDGFVRKFREEPLYHVQPRRRSRRDVTVEPGMLGKPLLNLGCLMSSVVVQYQMEVQVSARLAVNLARKAPRFIGADDGAGTDQ